jgi:septum formation protein
MATSFPIFILASVSPARAKVLSQINMDFEVIPSDVDESAPMDNPKNFVTTLALKKARTVGTRVKTKYKSFIVLGCDTIVFDPLQQVIGKPKDRNHAKQMLVTLSNSSHLVMTGCVLLIYPEQQLYQEVITTEVEFRDLSSEEIEYYLESEEWKGKAGGYAIQGLGRLLIKGIKGDYYNVVGLPMSWIWQTLLNHFGESFLKTVTVGI